MGAYVPVRAPTGSAGPREAFVPVRVDPFVPVLGTNRDQWFLFVLRLRMRLLMLIIFGGDTFIILDFRLHICLSSNCMCIFSF